jgi:FkbM family methyltransferase
MIKTFIDIGTNTFGGYNKLKSILGIDDSWYKVFIEPNPEHYDNIVNNIAGIPNSKFLMVAISPQNKEYELLTRDDMKGDSAATIMGIDFINLSIGEVNQAVPSYLKYVVQGKRFEDILKENESDEYYIKIDCEGCEFDILENFPMDYLPKVKRMFVEFHSHDNVARERQQRIISSFLNNNFTIENWD